MKKIIIILISVAIVINLSACTKGGELVSIDGLTYEVTGNADGQQLVPATSVAASATFNGWYDEQLNVLTITLNWTNIFTGSTKDVVTGLKLYGPATAGNNGNLVRSLPFTNSSASSTLNLAVGGITQLNTAERDAMYNGRLYYVLTTQNFPNGIIRGQLTAKRN